ncbi:MAG: trypsin-like serine peptidase [Streptomyces sp.]|uniref:trypsin-like serine peptidase n=1 Tax=Streptomyces sp. TaxID=1931 RepID=UPI003D6C3A5C
MSSIRRQGRRRPVLAVAATAAALALTATACQSGDGDSSTDARSKPSAEASSAEDLGLPKDLPKDLPASLQDLDKWRGGAWKNWDKDQWVREASDFANPYIKGHWKPDRMEKAEDNGKTVPADVETSSGAGSTDPEPRAVKARGVKTPYTRSAAPAGKVFFDTPRGPMVCSGTVVKDPRNPGKSNLVATAGHCVHSGSSGGWFRNIMFVPAYNNRGLSPAQVQSAQPQDVAPYGQWWGAWAQTTNYWMDEGAQSGGGGSQQDFAVLHVKPERQTGKSLEETVGAAVKINFKAPRTERFSGLSSYGYPAAPPFDGARMFSCTDKPGKLTIDPSQPALYRIGCTMTGGSSGGGWFMEGKGGKAELVSVNSIGPRPATWLAGPRLGPTAKNVFDAISKKYAGKN